MGELFEEIGVYVIFYSFRRYIVTVFD